MDKYNLNFKLDEIPKYIQISKHIKKLIDSDLIEDGEKLPSIRKLSDLLGVNNDTIINAYKRLQVEGYAVQKVGSGTYAKRKEISRNFKKDYSDTLKKLSPSILNQYVDFTGETASSEFFPVSTFKRVINEVLDRDGAEALTYQELLGYEGLRNNINKYFWNNKLSTEDVLIVSGAQQGIDIVSKALLNVNDNIIVEKPTYSGALSVFKGRRTNIYEVPMLQDGIDLNQFEKILKKNKIKCFYLMSYFQNPTGMTYSLSKKKEILDMAEYYDFYIIEDDYLSELIYDENIEYKSFKAMDDSDRVIYIKSFSKIFLPGIRIGYLIAPVKFRESIQNSKVNTDISTSSLMQRALSLYIEKGFWREHITSLKDIYANRYKYMEDKIEQILCDKVCFNSPGGGLNFYLQIDSSSKVNSIDLFYKCKENGVLLTPGVLFHKYPKEGEEYFRLGFSQVSNEKIEKGLNIINNMLKSE